MTSSGECVCPAGRELMDGFCFNKSDVNRGESQIPEQSTSRDFKSEKTPNRDPSKNKVATFDEKKVDEKKSLKDYILPAVAVAAGATVVGLGARKFLGNKGKPQQQQQPLEIKSETPQDIKEKPSSSSLSSVIIGVLIFAGIAITAIFYYRSRSI